MLDQRARSVNYQTATMQHEESQMKMLFLIPLLSLLASVAHAETIPGSYFKSGPWVGEAYTNDETGRWSHCVVSASYPNGYDLFFSLTQNYSLGLFVTSRNEPTFRGLSKFEVVSKVDNYEAMFGRATPFDDYTAGVWYEDLDLAIDEFKKGSRLTISSQIGVLKFNLKGTYKALEAAYDCASKYQNFTSSPKKTASSRAWEPNAAEKSAMYQLAAQIINHLEIVDFSFASPEEARVKGAVEFTSADGAVWGIIAVGRETPLKGDLTTLMAEDMANISSQFCNNGDIAAVNSTKIIEGVETKTFKGMCDRPNAPFYASATKQVISEKLVETIVIDFRSNLPGRHEPEDFGVIAVKQMKN
jgi:hypothetical protein